MRRALLRTRKRERSRERETFQQSKEQETMKKIASFTVNHDKLKKGMYISRIDGDVVTYDVRMKLPNGGDYFEMAAAHTLEHLFATYARNSRFEKDVVYVGPMGCRTGFYLLLRDSVSYADAILLVKESMAFVQEFKGAIPGVSHVECGNWLEHDLTGAKALASDLLGALENWTVEKLYYEV
jgi:S-ribosylhomocysteine lyase